MFWLEKCVPFGLGIALVLVANAGCSGEGDQLPALQQQAETPDAGRPEAPQHDAGSQSDAATPDVIPPSPTANAGTDQTVLAGATVTLSGQGHDATGAVLGYRWIQIAGPTVALDAPDQAQTTLTAPLVSGELEFQLAVQSENGQGSDRVKVSVSAAPALFVINRTEASVSRFAISPELDGNGAPEATWKGNNTRMFPPSALIMDKADGFVVATGEHRTLLGYSNAFGSGGNAFPERYFPGLSFEYGTTLDAMAYDRASDLLFLARNGNPYTLLYVYGGVATRDFTADALPKATVVFSAQQVIVTNSWKIRDLELSTSGELYMVHSGSENVCVVFSKASALNETTGWSRSFTISGIGEITDAFIDTSDRLYVVGSRAPEIQVFENASHLEDFVTPTRKITVTLEPVASGFNGITLDAAGTAYVTASNADAFYVIENIASRSGTVTPDRTVTGAATGLSGPGKLTAVAR